MIRSPGNFLASVELHEGRQAGDLFDATLTPIDSTGLALSAAVPGASIGPDPADPANLRKRVFVFGPEAALLKGNAFRFDARLASDGRTVSGRCQRLARLESSEDMDRTQK